eukprot:gene20330-24239_t
MFDALVSMVSSIFGKEKEAKKTENKLLTFLLGTVDSHSALRVLRGKGDILRIIWIYACSEWWQLHLQSYTIPKDPRDDSFETIPYSIPDLRRRDLFKRKNFDCPLALVDDNVSFPAVGSMSDGSGGFGPINVNMMPFDLFDPEGTLPSYLHGYVIMIKQCRSYVKSYVDFLHQTGQKRRQLPFPVERKRLDYNDLRNRIAYLTIDERPLSQTGASHRRGGVHVECPGALRSKEIADK